MNSIFTNINIARIKVFDPIVANFGIKSNRHTSISQIFVITFCLFIFFQVSSTQTKNLRGSTLIVWWSPNICIIGADTKLSAVGESVPDSVRICKIHVLGNDMVFSHAGVFQFHNGYNILELGKWAVYSGGTTRDMARRFRDSLKIVLPIEARINKTNIRGSGVDAVFLSKDSYTLPVSIISVRLVAKGKNIIPKVLIDTSFGFYPYSQKTSIWFPLGHRIAIERFIERMSPDDLTRFWKDSGVQGGIIKLIEMECDSFPNEVGRPIQLLIMSTKDNMQWIPSPPICKEIEIE